MNNELERAQVYQILALNDEMLRSGFEIEPAADDSWTLPGVVSRKKQFIPALMTAYQEL